MEINVNTVAEAFQAAMAIVGEYKAVRAKLAAEQPDAPLPDERPLFDALIADSQELQQHARLVALKYGPILGETAQQPATEQPDPATPAGGQAV